MYCWCHQRASTRFGKIMMYNNVNVNYTGTKRKNVLRCFSVFGLAWLFNACLKWLDTFTPATCINEEGCYNLQKWLLYPQSILKDFAGWSCLYNTIRWNFSLNCFVYEMKTLSKSNPIFLATLADVPVCTDNTQNTRKKHYRQHLMRTGINLLKHYETFSPCTSWGLIL